ncbi:MAG: hypothetical protein HY903_09020 [Deltaproteobacteria bacterium]|nr:hypothetical protein [Deltaproteobacteria bacterium]
MAADELINRGLELFAEGDLAAAIRVWCEARAKGGHSLQLDAMFEHVRAVAPDLVVAIEAEFSQRAPKASVGLESPPDSILPPIEPSPMTAAVLTVTPPAMAKAPGREAAALTVPSAVTIVPAPVLARDRGAAAAPSLAVPPPPVLPTIEAIAPPAPPSVPSAVEPAAVVPVAATSVAVEPQTAAGPWEGQTTLGPPLSVDGGGGGLALVAAKEPVAEPIAVPRGALAQSEARLRELLGLDDFTGALEVANGILAGDPDHPLASAARKRCRIRLAQIYSSKLGALGRTPKVLIPPDQVIWLDLDHRSGFLLAQVDGQSTYEDLIELSGMDRLEALRLIVQLVQKGVVGV